MTASTLSGPTILLRDETPRSDHPLSLRRVPLRLLVVAALVAVGFHASLGSLLGEWRYDSPLADLLLVPLVAVGLALLASHRHQFLSTVRMGRLDLLVAGLCLSIVAAALVLAPLSLGNYYWALRPDLLVLPLFVIAGVVLLLGTRAVVGLMFPLAYLLMAWPLPFVVVLNAAQGRLTSITSQAIVWILHVAPVAQVVSSGGDLRLHVGGGSGFDVSVASACSGIEGLTGLLIVGTAAMYLVRGRLRSRLAWLGFGLVVAWVANVVRIMLVLAAGAGLGKGVAMGVLHPIGGLVLLNGVFLLLMSQMHRFGLTRRSFGERQLSDVPLMQDERRPAAVTSARLWRRAALLAVAAAVIGFADSGVTATASTFDNNGLPASTAFSSNPDAGPAYIAVKDATNDWARPYFGSGSDWERYILHSASGHGYTMWLDSIVTSDVASLRAHSVASCYRFHGFSLQVHRRLSLAEGIVAQRFVYTRPDGAQWHTLTWEWPVSTGNGHIRHERVVLFGASFRSTNGPAKPAAEPQGPPLRDALMRLLDRNNPDLDSNSALTAALVAEANTEILLHSRPVTVARPSTPEGARP